MALPEITLAQFNRIASGSYNAGFVDFKTDDHGNVQNELTKVNNHVWKTGKNNVVLSPQRVVEVKEAFIAALRRGGVSEASINEVRAKLGIPAEMKLTDNVEEIAKMNSARFRPLSRQYVRVLLDTYAQGGVGMNAESYAAVSADDFAAAKKTAAMSGSDMETRKEVNRAAFALAQREGKKTREFTDSISLLTTTRPLADLLRAQHARCKGENAVNERNLATVALKSNFSSLFKAAFKMHTTNAQESEAFRMFGLEAKIVKGENGMLTAILGTGDLQTKVALGADAETFFSRLVGRAVTEMDTLDAPTMKDLLNTIYNHDLDTGLLASERTSITRQFACLILERKVEDAFNLATGNYNTGILVEIAERALANNAEPVDTKQKLDAYHAKLVRDNAGLPEDMKAMLEQVADVPFGKPYYEGSEFKVTAPIVANMEEVQAAIPPPPQGPAPIAPRDIGGMEAIKNFVADIVFSDDTMVSDVVVNRPGESMRKFLSSDKNLIALAEIIKSLEKEKVQEEAKKAQEEANKNKPAQEKMPVPKVDPTILDFALSSKIAPTVKDGFRKLAKILSDAYLAQPGANGETLAQALAHPNGLQLFANFFRNSQKLPGAELAKFDAAIQTMANKGCENLQSFINTVFKVNTANANAQGALTTDPYKDKSPDDIKKELEKKSLNDILDAASTSDAPGQVGFFKQVVSSYFTKLAKADKRSCFAAAMRYAQTFEFGNLQGDELKSAEKVALNKFTGAILKGTSPLLQKMMQGLPKEIMGDFADALADMKANLAPIPRKVVQAHFMDIINKSNGKIKAIELMKSLGAASVGEAFLCKFTHMVRRQKTEAYEDPQDRLIKLRPVLGNDGQPVMEDVEETVECVVKIMRHDAELRVQREAEIFTEEAKKIPGMDKTWQGQLNQYMKEFDFRTEAENINAGVQLYDVKGGTNAELEAIAPELRSMKLSSLVPPSKNVLVAEVAIGQTVDSYFKERIDQIRNAASAVFERDPATKRIKWVDGPIDPETKKPRPVPVLRQDIPATAVVNMQHWICSNYADLKRASDKILQATKAWFYEAILGSGKFHGDTHSGNLMVARNDITFIDFGNLYKLEANRPDGVNERHELMRVIMGAAFRNKDFVLAGFEKLLSAEGKAALNANREKAEAILDAVLSKGTGKGSFSFNIVYRLQAAVVELQKLGLELPPQINCFIQSLVRLSNAVTEMNTIMNQCKAMLDATTTMVRPPVPVDDLDLVGKIFNESMTAAGQQKVKLASGTHGNRRFPAFINTMMSDEYGGWYGAKVTQPMFNPGENGTYYNGVYNRIANAQNPVAEAEKLYTTLVDHADREHNQFHHFMLEELDAAIAKFREDWAHANTPEEKSAAVNAFTAVFSRSEANILQTMQNHATEVGTYNLESPNTFASAITGILFDEFDALSAGLSEAEQNTIGFNARAVARDELGLPLYKSFSQANIIQCLVEDSQRTEGDKNYKVDIGV